MHVVDWSGGRATPWGLAAHRTPQEALLCAKAKRQQQIFYLRVSGKAPSRNGNQHHGMVMNLRDKNGYSTYLQNNTHSMNSGVSLSLFIHL
ncbi:hypothetical protein ACZ11_10050 [Lysinibacillus xylanilyticus]|uniref:Uncharacterized protein n=1 Tax=Lysinibacillus xylanilyticus TaxID=582475 RepID=A0A0K9FDA0_9BACI|nr:hypothetical protein ACZ11_10050 [Lysinibacillus xylanilyticus]